MSARAGRGFGTGKPRGSRGRGRGKSVAQSGGIASSWADTKQGAGSQRKAGGGSQDNVTNVTNRRGSKVTTRTPAGDKHKSKGNGGSAKFGAPKAISGNPFPTPSNGQAQYVQPTVRKDIYGRGGSRG